MEVKENPPYDTWPPAPLPPVTIIYDNSHDPFYWDFAWLSVKGSVTESDWPGWPDPDDHAETPNIWETGEDILAGTWLFNEEGDPYRSYTFLISPGEDFLMACMIKITFLNP
jgi:hypothetical protein